MKALVDFCPFLILAKSSFGKIGVTRPCNLIVVWAFRGLRFGWIEGRNLFVFMTLDYVSWCGIDIQLRQAPTRPYLRLEEQ